MTPEEYLAHDAVGLADLVRRGETTPDDLLDAALDATAAVNGDLNVVVSTFEDAARAAIRAGLPDGPFKGVPFLLKDLTAQYAGQPTGSAWGPRLNRPVEADTELVKRYKDAGLVIFGKTTVPELAMDWSTESRAHGASHNPWNPGHTTGTSSGGSAAAVAAGIVPMAHGNDGGGSIRVPASCCGVFGMKPSRGRNPAAPDGDRWMGMLCEHALIWTVRDSAALLDATAGPHPHQFYNSPAGGNFAAEVGQAPGKLRIAVSTRAPYGAPTHPDCIRAVEAQVKLLEELGHSCEWRDIDLPESGWRDFNMMINAEYASDMEVEEKILGRPVGPEDFAPVIWDIIQLGRTIRATDYAQGLAGTHKVAQAVLSLFDDYDVFLSPTLAKPPVRLGSFDLSVTPEQHYTNYLAWMPYTHLFNISGSPAMSVPAMHDADGLPIGCQFAARPAAEALLFRLAGQLEAARPWAGRRPPIHYGA